MIIILELRRPDSQTTKWASLSAELSFDLERSVKGLTQPCNPSSELSFEGEVLRMTMNAGEGFKIRTTTCIFFGYFSPLIIPKYLNITLFFTPSTCLFFAYPFYSMVITSAALLLFSSSLAVWV